VNDISDEAQNARESAWVAGHRAAWVQLLNTALRNLGYDDPESQKANWATEREGALRHLRELCADFGDNNWPNTLDLGDAIDKHLSRHLYRNNQGRPGEQE